MGVEDISPEIQALIDKEVRRVAERAKFYEDLNTATTKLLSDWPTDPVDTIYFFGRSFLDAERWGVYQTAVDLYNQGVAHHIIIPGTEGEQHDKDVPRVSTPGKTLIRNRLVRMGIPNENIHDSQSGFSHERPDTTKAEGASFLRFSQEHNWQSAVVVANPHQIVRPMLGLVRTMNTQGLSIDIYAATPRTTDWDRNVRGSQGMHWMPRSMHIQEEVRRIVTYQQKGDLASFDELSAYMSQRGKGR